MTRGRNMTSRIQGQGQYRQVGDSFLSQLTLMLNEALEKEVRIWTPNYNTKLFESTDLEVSQDERDGMTKWLIELTEEFQYNPETYALGVSILDRFLNAVKVRPKYLVCTTVTCFYLAAKVCEEDENIPSTHQFLEECQCDCTINEVLRMEKVILNKLNWDLVTVTALDFLYILHTMMLTEHPNLLASCRLSAGKQLDIILYKTQLCVANHQLQPLRPSIIALAIISLELELFRHDWLSIAIQLQEKVKVESVDLIRCREMISRHMSPQLIRSHYTPPPVKTSKRKVEHVEVDEIYDCIKRLYSEEGGNTTETTRLP